MSHQKTILVIDDDLDLLNIYQATLTGEGYAVIIYPGAAQALNWLTNNQPDLIILDIMMPQISGVDFLEELRATPHGQQVLVIIASASQKWSEAELEQYKIAHFVNKPVFPKELVRKIHSLLHED